MDFVNLIFFKIRTINLRRNKDYYNYFYLYDRLIKVSRKIDVRLPIYSIKKW